MTAEQFLFYQTNFPVIKNVYHYKKLLFLIEKNLNSTKVDLAYFFIK